MKFTTRFFFVLALCMAASELHAQRFFSVVFDKLPKDMQLFAREDDNMAEIPISGKIELAGWDHFSVVTYRNKVRYGYQKSVLDYGGKTTANFAMSPKIKAEMADYEIEVYACHEADSILIVRRSELVGGDFYVINGQSNAAAGLFGNWSSKYARTVARIPDDSPALLPGDTLWIQSSWSWPYTGAWGVEMQKQILENDSIPTCVINGALPGSKIEQHLERDANNSANATVYGLLYSRIKVAAPKRIRAFFWYQGEQDALENIQNYPEQYDKLYKYWQTDYPQVDKFVVVQIPVLFNPYYVAGSIREFQRKTKYTYAKTEHFNVSGLPGFDGIHYSLAGYQELGRRFYHFLKPMFYGSTDTSDVTCPDIQKVFYSSEKKDEITLVYEPNQHLVWPKDTLIDDVNYQKFTKGLKEVFYFDGDESKPANILAGTAAGNRVTLKLNAASTAKKLTYLPAYKGEIIRIYYGPFLKNTRGLAAFSFQEVGIADILQVSPFEAKESNMATVMVSWKSEGAETYVLERKSEQDQDFVAIDTFDSKTLSYEDKDVSPDATYSYRIQAFSKSSQSEKKTVTVKMLPLLSVNSQGQEVFWRVYPNPTSDLLSIELRNPEKGTLRLLNAGGQSVRQVNANGEKRHFMDVSKLPSGVYILSLRNLEGAVTSKKIYKK